MTRGMLFLVAAASLWTGLPDQEAPARTALSFHLMSATGHCQGMHSPDAPFYVQRRAMRCMVNFARLRAGLSPLSPARRLARSANSRAREILRCNSFSHWACGRAFASWMRRVGCPAGGENLAWGTGEAATVRSIFRGWMRSPSHRHNILGHYGQLGIGLRAGTLGGVRGVHVWTQHFGSHCRPAHSGR